MKYSSSLKKGKEVDNKKSTAIYSAALQDHFLKKFNSNVEIDFSIKKHQQKRKISTTKNLPSLTSQMDFKIKKLQSENKKSILPYEDKFLKKLKQAKSDFQKMKNYNKKLTWAQKLGIVQAPPLPLTSKDWQNIEEKSKARNDSQSICSICLEDFKIQPQVLLSCSHVFHFKCLTSYQKHNKLKCCPICRYKDYEKKVIDQAIRLFTLKSIILIQRVYRGSKDRISLYSSLVDKNYKASSARFNRRLIGFKMWRISLKITQKVKRDTQRFQKMLEMIKIKSQKDKQQIIQEMIQIQRKKILDSNKIQSYLQKFGIKTIKKAEIKKAEWQQKLKVAVNRKEEQCSICLTKLFGKPIYLLSCTHMFHANCIESFERYAIPGNQNKCPCCRSNYQKKLIKQQRQ